MRKRHHAQAERRQPCSPRQQTSNRTEILLDCGGGARKETHRGLGCTGTTGVPIVSAGMIEIACRQSYPGGSCRMKIYVASSWRNEYQPAVVKLLREDGHEVYDFKDSEGFRWSEVDLEWNSWTPHKYLEGLKHPCAERGFNRDMTALRNCDICVYVMPCGPSASMEMGWAVAAGKHVIV